MSNLKRLQQLLDEQNNTNGQVGVEADSAPALAPAVVAPAPTPTLQELLAQQKAEEAEESYQQSIIDVENMGTFGRFGNGLLEGGIGMFQGAGNMMGLVDDDTIAQRKLDNRALSDTTAGSVGQFIGEAGALAPLAFMGPTVAAVGTGVGAISKALSGYRLANAVLPTAQKVLSGLSRSRVAMGAAEGGLAGAIAANPNERGAGAAGGATVGGGLSVLSNSLGRFGLRGLAKTTPESQELRRLAQSKLNRKPFIPAGQSMDRGAGALSATTASVMDVASLLPSAQAKMATQSSKFADDMYETNLMQMFGGMGGRATKESDAAIKVFRESGGDVKMAIEAGKNAKNTPQYTNVQNIGNEAASTPSRGRYSGSQLRKASERSVAKGEDFGNLPLRKTATQMEKVMDASPGSSTFAARQLERDTKKSIGELAGAAADFVSLGLGRVLGSETFQNFLIGNTSLQVALKKAVDSKNSDAIKSIIMAARRTMAAQPVIDDESNDFRSLQGRLQSYIPDSAVNFTKGMMQ